MATPGRFVWHDLMTTDVERAKGFYAELFAWRFADKDMGEMGSYTTIHVGERGIGGVVALDGVPSHWISYVTVDDIDTAMGRVTAAGGRVCVPPTGIPDAGRFAVVEDPGGAVVSPFVFAGDAAPEDTSSPQAGTVCWNELLTTGPEVARPFYQGVFGWGHGAMDMGKAGSYHLFKRDGKDVAGMLALPAGAVSRPRWLPYFLTADVDATYARAVDVGAITDRHVAPQDVPGVGRFATLGDPTGAAFGLFQGGRWAGRRRRKELASAGH